MINPLQLNQISKNFLQSILFIAVSIIVSGCNTNPALHYKGEDAATIMLAVTSSSGIPPTLSLRRANEQKILEILYDSSRDKVYAPEGVQSENRIISITRQIPPGDYLIVGAGLGGTEGPLNAQKIFEPPFPITVMAREMNYIGSYKVNLKVLPDAQLKTEGKVTTVALSGFTLDFAMTDDMSEAVKVFAISNPMLNIQRIRNATAVAAGRSK